MADYYPLLSRAVQALSNNSAASRKAVFDRAREALTTQLSSMSSVKDNDLERERLALEEAILRIESEAEESALRAQNALIEPKDDEQVEMLAAAVSKKKALIEEDETPKEIPEEFFEQQEQPDAEAEVEVAQSEIGDDLKDTIVVETYEITDVKNDLAEFDAEVQQNHETFDQHIAQLEELKALTETQVESVVDDARIHETDVVASNVFFGVGDEATKDTQLNTHIGENTKIDPDEVLNIPDIIGEDVFAPKQSDIKKKFYMKVAVIAGAVILIGAATLAFVLRDKPVTLVKTENSEQVQNASKASDRLNEDAKAQTQSGAPAPSLNQPKKDVAAVTQRAILYEEAPDSPDKGKVLVGNVVWRLETQSSGAGQTPETVVRADVDVPERKLKMVFLIRRNLDQALPASHTLEMQFIIPADFPHAGIANVPGVLTKANEAVRGAPLAGLSVRITNGFFLVGLANTANERSVNERQLLEHMWIDIPVLYNNGRRALMTIEKGVSGERVMQQAFDAWKAQ